MARSPLIDVAWGYMRAQILRAAIELDVGEVIGAGSRSAADVAASAGTDPTSMLRLLRALTALGVTDHDGPDRFVLTELGHELRRDVPGSVRDIVLFLTAGYVWDAWGDASWSFRTGSPSFDRRHGMGAFDYLSDHPDEAAIFHGAMSQHTREAADAIISSYDFSPFSRVVDLGGGDGTLLARLLRQHPAIHGVLFDLPHGAGAAHEALRAAGVGDRCEVVGGSFFDGVPAVETRTS